ncbi:hypothetical protein ACOYR1_06410 [Thalassotalea piscium]
MSKNHIIFTFIILSIIGFQANAETASKIELLDDAKIFAKFDDKKPLVANYFTAHNENEIIDFYKEKYGEIVTQESIKDIRILKFSHLNNNIRVIISHQDNRQQVDLLIN